MSIEIAQEIKIADTQKYKFLSQIVRKDKMSGKLIASVIFEVFNENNVKVRQVAIVRTGVSFNDFSVNFNSWHYLAQLLVAQENLPVEFTPELIAQLESEFLNPIE